MIENGKTIVTNHFSTFYSVERHLEQIKIAQSAILCPNACKIIYVEFVFLNLQPRNVCALRILYES